MNRDVLKQQLETWRNEVARLLTDTTLSYEAIARETGCSFTTVYQLAKTRGLRRKADKTTEVSNG